MRDEYASNIKNDFVVDLFQMQLIACEWDVFSATFRAVLFVRQFYTSVTNTCLKRLVLIPRYSQ